MTSDNNKYRIAILALLIAIAGNVLIPGTGRTACYLHNETHEQGAKNCCVPTIKKCTPDLSGGQLSEGHCSFPGACNLSTADTLAKFQSTTQSDKHVQAALIAAVFQKQFRDTGEETYHPTNLPTSFPAPPIFLLNRTLLN